MYLDRTYKPRRRRRNRLPFWPLLLIVVIGIVLYEEQPEWLSTQRAQPTAVPTRSAVSFLAEAEMRLQGADFGGAIQAYEEMARLEPQNPEPLMVLSVLYLILQDADASQRLAEQAVEISPENADALAFLARALDWQGDYEDAVQYAFDGLEYQPDNANVLAVLGEIYSDIRNFPIAEGHLEEAYVLEPNNPLVLRNMAYLQEAQGNYEESIALLDRAIAEAPYRVAADLGLSVSAVYMAKSRVLRRLREELDGLDLMD